MNGPDRRCADRCPEGGEVVPALEDRPGPRHRGGVERGPHPECQALAKRTTRPVPDGVAVFPKPRRAARMEALGHASDVSNRDVRRQKSVDRSTQILRREAAGIGERDHLVRGVHPGVGPARSVDSEPCSPIQLGERVLERSLDRPSSPLRLVPGEVRAIVFNPCAEAVSAPEGTLSGACVLRPVRAGRFPPRHRAAVRSARYG